MLCIRDRSSTARDSLKSCCCPALSSALNGFKYKIVEIKYGNGENTNIFNTGMLDENVRVGFGAAIKRDMGFEVKEMKFNDFVVIKWLMK